MAEIEGTSRMEPAEGEAAAWQRILLCISVANICFLRVWNAGPPYVDQWALTFLPQLFSRSHYLLLVVNEMLLGTAFWFWLRKAATGRPGSRAIGLIGGAVFYTLGSFAIRSLVGSGRRWLAMDAALIAIGAGLLFFRAKVWPVLRTVLLFGSVIAVVNAGAAVWMGVRTDRGQWGEIERPTVKKATSRAAGSGRVLLVVFDEWDQVLTFENRDKSLALRNFDAFRSEALYASHALQPGGSTTLSIPALTTGTTVESVDAEGPRAYRLKGKSGSMEWEQADNVFARANGMGVPVAIVGWYLPYCRLFGSEVSGCWNWPSLIPEADVFTGDAVDDWLTQWQLILEWNRYTIKDPGRPERRLILKAFAELHDTAIKVAADERYGFVYLHLRDTHSPYFYDRRTGTFMPRASATKDGYLSSLALADQTLGQIREAMLRTGTWDKTTIILTADHHLRIPALGGTNSRRVPLLIRMPGENGGLTVDHPFRTTVMKDLISELLAGHLPGPADVAEYLSHSE